MVAPTVRFPCFYGLRDHRPLATVLLHALQQSCILAQGPCAFLYVYQSEPTLAAVLVVAAREGVRHTSPADSCVRLIDARNLGWMVRDSGVRGLSTGTYLAAWLSRAVYGLLRGSIPVDIGALLLP